MPRLPGGVALASEPAFGALADRQLERVRAADPTIAAKAIGWLPRTGLDEGLAQTVEFYPSNLDRLPAI
jgi:nucleoside-diphosphate-sugar epimerase